MAEHFKLSAMAGDGTRVDDQDTFNECRQRRKVANPLLEMRIAEKPIGSLDNNPVPHAESADFRAPLKSLRLLYRH